MPSNKIANDMGRSIWTGNAYKRVKTLMKERKDSHFILGIIRQEYDLWHADIKEVEAEMALLKGGTDPNIWTPKMVKRLKELLREGKVVNDITNMFFEEFREAPSLWQEVYRKIQQLKITGELVHNKRIKIY
ncbi:MAG: hypothetical protein Q9220_000128 [cf. Caloplaca sp. 1 TL-2023]